MSELTSVAEFLTAYGGWAVSIILGIVIRFLYKDFKSVVKEKDNIILKQNKDHHDEIVAVVTECTGVLTAVNENLAACQQRQQGQQEH